MLSLRHSLAIPADNGCSCQCPMRQLTNVRHDAERQELEGLPIVGDAWGRLQVQREVSIDVIWYALAFVSRQAAG